MVLPTHSDDTWGGDGVEGRLPGLTCESASPPLVYSHNGCRRVCYVENGEGGFHIRPTYLGVLFFLRLLNHLVCPRWQNGNVCYRLKTARLTKADIGEPLTETINLVGPLPVC